MDRPSMAVHLALHYLAYLALVCIGKDFRSIRQGGKDASTRR